MLKILHKQNNIHESEEETEKKIGRNKGFPLNSHLASCGNIYEMNA